MRHMTFILAKLVLCALCTFVLAPATSSGQPYPSTANTEDYTRWAREQYAIEKTVVEKFGLKP
jgi:hypothetical protein